MPQYRNLKEMTDYDAAAALLMLSSGCRSSPPEEREGIPSPLESNNNYSTTTVVVKPRHHPAPAHTSPGPRLSDLIQVNLTSPEPKSSRGSTQPKQVPSRTENRVRQRVRQRVFLMDFDEEQKLSQNVENDSKQVITAPLTFSPSHEQQSAGGMNLMIDAGRFGSASPTDLVHRWDSSRTSSPILPNLSGLLPSPHSALERYGDLRGSAGLYDSPGMNGFALQLNSKAVGRSYRASSPDTVSKVAASLLSEHDGKTRRPYNPPASSASNNSEEKSLNSPTDSGVSSIHDEILQPKLIVKTWTSGAHVGEGLPPLVRAELRKISETSTHQKDLYTRAKMAKFPLELGFNPNKSRFRKECPSPSDQHDREKNNEASRRSRHKRKLMTQMMAIGLEFDRNENRQLYLQERRLTEMIFVLEEKVLNAGTESHVLRKIRADCGFQ